MGLFHPVKRKLILLAAVFFQPPADFIVQMKRISKNRKGNIFAFQQVHQPPKIRMKDGVTSGNIKIRKTVIYLTEILAVRHHFLHLLPRHGVQFLTVVFRKDITMLTSLITVICDMPLKSKIFFHESVPSFPFPIYTQTLSKRNISGNPRQLLCTQNCQGPGLCQAARLFFPGSAGGTAGRRFRLWLVSGSAGRGFRLRFVSGSAGGSGGRHLMPS